MDVEELRNWLKCIISDELKNHETPQSQPPPEIIVKIRGNPENRVHFYTASLKKWESTLTRSKVQIPISFAKLLAESIVESLKVKDHHFEAVNGFINYIPDVQILETKVKPWEDQADIFSIRSIGRIRSVFRSKFACPRQGIIKNSRALLSLSNSVMSEVTMGLEAYSHVTLIWMFDQHKVGSKGTHTFVSPPRLDGKRVGWMSTRTPHRVNNVGLSVVKLDSVNGRTLHLSGVDLVDGTAIIDVKPYIPLVDSFPNALIPAWVRNPHKRLDVTWKSEVRDGAKTFIEDGELDFYGTSEAQKVLTVIEEVISLDPRSKHSKRKHSIGGIHGFLFDNLEVVFVMVAEELAEIVFVDVHDEAEGFDVNTAGWLEAIKLKIGMRSSYE